MATIVFDSAGVSIETKTNFDIVAPIADQGPPHIAAMWIVDLPQGNTYCDECCHDFHIQCTKVIYY